MTFIAVLLLTIAMTIVQIANIYNKGQLSKEIDQTSRDINQELDRAMRSSGTFSTDTTANKYVNKPWGGRLCMGTYSYAWNYGTAIDAVSTDRNQYSSVNTAGLAVRSGGVTRYDIGFVKVPDSGGSLCVANATTGKYPNINPLNAVEMLRAGDHSLVLHTFVVSSPAKDLASNQQLYKISYTLGTSRIEAMNVTPTEATCKIPGTTGADPNYCSVQKFTIVLRVVSGVN